MTNNEIINYEQLLNLHYYLFSPPPCRLIMTRNRQPSPIA